MSRPRLSVLVLCGAFLGAAGCAPSTAESQDTPPNPRPNIYEVSPGQVAALMAIRDSQPGTLQVSGSASVSVATDQARIDFAVETEAPSAQAAVSENATLMEAVLEALRGADLPGLSAETHGYRLSPRYVTRQVGSSRTREIEGYTAVNHIRATVDDPAAAGRLIDVAVEAGANRVASLSFLASDPEEARLKALALAVAKARAEAEAIAAAMGMELGPPVSVSGGARSSPPPPIPAMAMEATRTPVEPGDENVSATVTITYALKVRGR